MSPSDLPAFVQLLLAVACAGLAFLCFATVPAFWRRRWDDPAIATLWCRVFALLLAVIGGGFTAAAFGYTMGGVVAPLASLYWWLVL